MTPGGRLCSAVLPSPRWLLNSSLCALCSAESLYTPLLSSHTFFSVRLMDLDMGRWGAGGMSTKYGQYKATHSISKCLYFLLHPSLFHPLLILPSLSLLSHLADGRLNTGHAGVLLTERRGSYPLIDLHILKSKSVVVSPPIQLASI